MKRVIGEIFYEENKRLKIITKIIQIPLLNYGISAKLSKKGDYEKASNNLALKIIEKTFDEQNKELLVSLF